MAAAKITDFMVAIKKESSCEAEWCVGGMPPAEISISYVVVLLNFDPEDLRSNLYNIK